MLEVVRHPDLIAYFSAGLLVKNETEILDADGKILRPDRVVINDGELCVIDYKTGEKSKNHKMQISAYADVFKKVGYKSVRSKLVYLNNEVEVVEV